METFILGKSVTGTVNYLTLRLSIKLGIFMLGFYSFYQSLEVGVSPCSSSSWRISTTQSPFYEVIKLMSE